MRIFNKQASYNYRILESFEVGIALNGGEVKSIRAGRADLSKCFARIQNGEVYLINAYINPYQGQDPSYDPYRKRKLLLHRAQINSLLGKLSKGGMALVPLSIYEKRNFFKVQLGLGQSKSKIDKKRSIKEKEEQKRLEQELKEWE